MVIQICESRFRIESYPTNGANTFTLPNKKEMVYQFVVGLKSGYRIIQSISTARTNKIDSRGLDEILILYKNKTINPPMTGNYDFESTAKILAFIYAIPINYKDPLEALILSVKNGLLISSFYNAFSPDIQRGVKQNCKYLIRNREWYKNCTNYPVLPRRCFKKGQRYSVTKLLLDLERTGSSFIADYELMKGTLIGPHEKRRACMEKIKENFVKILGVVGNQNRANLSLEFKQPITVSLPKNKFGIDKVENLTVVRNLNIVKDACINTAFILVKIPEELARVLRSVNCVEAKFINLEDSDKIYLLDLRKLPVLSKREMKPLSIEALSRLVWKYTIAKEALFYKRIKASKDRYRNGKEDLSEKELFLRANGIYGSSYYPPYEGYEDPKYEYETEMIYYRVSGFLAESERKISTILIRLGLMNGRPHESYSKFLDMIDRNPYDWEKICKILKIRLRYEIFKIYVGKSYSLFSEKTGRKVFIDGSHISVKKESKTFVNWKIKKVTVKV